jgi:hypothetical protein
LFIPPPVWLVVLKVGRYQNRAKESKAEKISHFRTTGEMVQISEPSQMERKAIAQISKVANVSHDTIAKVATPKPPLKRTKNGRF